MGSNICIHKLCNDSVGDQYIYDFEILSLIHTENIPSTFIHVLK